MEEIPSGPFERITPTSVSFQFWAKLAKELARGGLAFGLVAIFFATIYWAFGKVGTSSWSDTKQLLDVLIPTESALLGAAVAFFFSGL